MCKHGKKMIKNKVGRYLIYFRHLFLTTKKYFPMANEVKKIYVSESQKKQFSIYYLALMNQRELARTWTIFTTGQLCCKNVLRSDQHGG